MHMMRTARMLSMMNANRGKTHISRDALTPELTFSTVAITFICVIAILIYLMKKMK